MTRKKDEAKDSDFKDAAKACLPLINAALDDIVKGTFLRGCLLNIGVPSAPSANKVIFSMILLNLKFHFRGNGYTKSPPF